MSDPWITAVDRLSKPQLADLALDYRVAIATMSTAFEDLVTYLLDGSNGTAVEEAFVSYGEAVRAIAVAVEAIEERVFAGLQASGGTETEEEGPC